LEDRRALAELQVAVDQEGHDLVGVHPSEFRRVVLACEQLDHLQLDLDVMVQQEQADRPAGRRQGVVIELHGGPPQGVFVRRPDRYRRSPSAATSSLAGMFCIIAEWCGCTTGTTSAASWPWPATARPWRPPALWA